MATSALLVASACGRDATTPQLASGSSLVLATTLPPLDSAREGRYFAWWMDAGGTAHVLGAFTPGAPVTYAATIEAARSALITLELPGVSPSQPSARVVLRGDFADSRAELSIEGALTQGDLSLTERPGQFTMFTPSDNDVRGYPSFEEAGVWLFNMNEAETPQNDFYVRMTQLGDGWTYEGWMVRDLGAGSGQEIWLSYGKFVPDWTGALNQPDDTGWGPFSGVSDFQNSRLEDFPGDDWVGNPLGLHFPPALQLPLNLREKDAAGQSRWTHVISIEPMSDKGERLTTERPFFIRPYADLFGDSGPGAPRSITFRPASLPTGHAIVR